MEILGRSLSSISKKIDKQIRMMIRNYSCLVFNKKILVKEISSYKIVSSSRYKVRQDPINPYFSFVLPMCEAFSKNYFAFI